nr:immunoglobulin light chain junction region [Macaca mulatta]MOW57396.1 immunoglobulin light chain junction region [Macaca mulatta]MOW57774.1 immunoglobulin light chain junction region [Macaca mulatta]MOW57807.1 immunoglobulin light chain junction region [Macaca mulatta]MOW58794.1 immunoglobulin light chain junction region [Macaca mulatta]
DYSCQSYDNSLRTYIF